MPESTQHKLSRIRPPRVQITYDLETGGAIIMKELPFIVGVMSDLSGDRKEELPPLKQRKFVEIDRDNFEDVLESIGPRLEYSVPNRLTEDGSKNIKAELNFSSMDDFHPGNLIQQIKPLRELYEARQRLLDLFVKLDGNDELEALLQDIVRNTDDLQQITDLNKPGDDAAEGAEAEAAADGDSPAEDSPAE